MKKVESIIAFLFLFQVACFAQDAPTKAGDADEAFYQKCREVSAKYSGVHEIVLKREGLKLRPDKIDIRDGCAVALFKGVKTVENEYERGMVVPLTEIESIDNEPVAEQDAVTQVSPDYTAKPASDGGDREIGDGSLGY